jgi:hypothetical protein
VSELSRVIDVASHPFYNLGGADFLLWFTAKVILLSDCEGSLFREEARKSDVLSDTRTLDKRC